MSALLDVKEKLGETHAAIARLEQAAAEGPESPALLASLRSLRKREQDLETTFLKLTHQRSLDVCSYRIIPENGDATLSAVTAAWSDFQRLFSIVYDSLAHGPKQTTKLSAEVIASTSFGFAYSFSGSVGLVLTLPNERLLVDQTNLDKAMETVFRMARTEATEDLREYARRLGLAPIRAMYSWASDHVEAALGADIEWRRELRVRASLFLQRPEIQRLQRTIAQTSEETEETITVTGELCGADVKTRMFHMEFAGGTEPMRGRMADTIGHQHTLELPRRYDAVVRKRTKVFYATEKEEVNYFLMSLTPAC